MRNEPMQTPAQRPMRSSISPSVRSATSLFLLGGSSFYTLPLIESLKRHQVLPGLRRITLFGRDEARLAAVAQMCRSICADAELTTQLTIDISMDLADALKPEYGVLFNQLRFGGMRARDLDEKLAIRHGLVADETLGMVGVSNAIRTIRGMTPFLATLQRKQGPYTLINFTNPCSIVTQYMIEHWGIPAVGICDYPEVLRSSYAALVGEPRGDVELKYFGVNHFGFIYDVLLRGDSIFSEVKSRLDRCPLAPSYHRSFDYIIIPAWDLIFDRRALWQAQQQKVNRASFLYALEQELAQWVQQTPVPELSAERFLNRLSARACDWYDLIVTPVLANLLGFSRIPLVLNLGHPDPFSLGCTTCVLESNAVMEDGGHVATGFDAGISGSYEFALVASMKRIELELLEACLTRSPQRLVAACLRHPMIQDHRAIRAYLDDLADVDPIISEFMKGASPDESC